MTFLAHHRATLAVAVLQWYASRRDIRETERGRMALEAARLAQGALQWKADHPLPVGADLDGPAGLRVRDDAGTLQLPADRPPPA
mgnify:FL=1